MKKYIVLLLIAGLCQSCGILGLYLGVGPSTIFGGSSWKDPVGAQIGVESKIMEISESSSLSSGVNLTWQGAGYEETYGEAGYGDMSFSGKVRLGYVNVPFIYTYATQSNFFGEIGLQPGVLLVAKDKYENESVDYKDAISTFELGLPFGVGYRVNEQVTVGLRGTYGITNLDNTDSGVADHNFLLVGRFVYNIKWPGK
jgi:hypothetical protein